MARKSLSSTEKEFRQLSNTTINTAINIIASQKVNFVQLKKPGNSSKGRQQRDTQDIYEKSVNHYKNEVKNYITQFGQYDLKECINASIHQNPLIGKPRASLLQLIEDQCRTLKNSIGFNESQYKQNLLIELENIVDYIESNFLSKKGKVRRSIEILQKELKECRKLNNNTQDIEEEIKSIMSENNIEGFHEPYTDYFVNLYDVIEYIQSKRIKQVFAALNKYLFNKKKFEIHLLDVDFKKSIILNTIAELESLDKAA